MKIKEFKEYSNAADIDPTKIPQATLNIIADIFYSIYERSLQTSETEKKTA